MNANSVYLVMSIVVTGGIIVGGLLRASRVVMRVVTTGEDLGRSVRDNTDATSKLSEQFTEYRSMTDRRIGLLEEAVHGRRRRLL